MEKWCGTCKHRPLYKASCGKSIDSCDNCEPVVNKKATCDECVYFDFDHASSFPCAVCKRLNEEPTNIDWYISNPRFDAKDVSPDQKAKADYGKEKLTLVPRRIIHDICAIRMYGNEKYPDGGPDNWKEVETQRYRDAAFRHFLSYLEDPDGVDKESGFPHLWHLACNIAFLCEMEDKKHARL